MRKRLLVAMVCALVAVAHESGMRNRKPSKADPDLKKARAALDSARRKLTAQGRYRCCVKPGCDLCLRINGSCNCAENVQAGKGSCGECYAAWKAGRGAVKGVDSKSVALLSAQHQACPRPANPADVPETDLRIAAESLLRAKRILVGEKRFACCIRGGCGQCAHEGFCPCGADLAAKKNGVCGDCLDRWRAGEGAFAGIDPAEVALALSEAGIDAIGMYGGTSQLPAASPMYMLSRLFGGWTTMASGQLFGVYSNQTGPRGRDKIFSANWLMLMAAHRVGPGTLTLRTMLSAEPSTFTRQRYPLLFATGETANGVPIINGQHPHDLVMELAASYKVAIGERTAIHLYGGPRGEPALGPPAFPHRPSASENPVAVIGHHLQDSTHISSNVVTAGIKHGPVTWEVSGFRGREPDEKRWGIETGTLDSLSTRLTVSPTVHWSGQFSIGRINHGEVLHPLRPALRTSASLIHARPFANGTWATSLIWGRVHDLPYTQIPTVPAFSAERTIRPRHIVTVPTRIPSQIYNSFLAETTLRWNRNWIWGRAENADKNSTLLYEESPFVLLVDEVRLARIQAYTAGYERELPARLNSISTGIGAQFTLYHVPQLLAPIYNQHPAGIQLFFRVRLGNGR